jgi:hypothetical protein
VIEKFQVFVLARIYSDYPADTRDLSQHTIDRIFGAFDRLEAAAIWLERLDDISIEDTLTLLNQIPEHRISPIAIEFAQRILIHNRAKLLKFRAQL